MHPLSEEASRRSQAHSRHALLPQIGPGGIDRLRAAHALVVGCGALGSAAIELLARAGVGSLTIVDRDIVEPSNLNRQTLFDTTDAREGLPKAIAARQRLQGVAPSVRVRAHADDVTSANAERYAGIAGADRVGVIVDATDNAETRYLLNDLAVAHAIPLVYAGVVGTEATAMSVLARGGGPWSATHATPCLRCVFPEPPAPGTLPTCDTVGVLSTLCAMVGAWQATEALKVLLQDWACVSRSLVRLEAWSGRAQRIDTSALLSREDCPCCAGRTFPFLHAPHTPRAATLCGRDAVQLAPQPAMGPPDLDAIARRLSPHAHRTLYFVRATVTDRAGQPPVTLTVFPDGRALVMGTSSVERARAVVSRYVGT